MNPRAAARVAPVSRWLSGGIRKVRRFQPRQLGQGNGPPGRLPLGERTRTLRLGGFAFVVVSAGVVFAELVHVSQRELTTQSCPSCMREGHDKDAEHCKYCGGKL